MNYLVHDAFRGCPLLFIPNGCLDAYEVKVNKDTCKYQTDLSIPEIDFKSLKSCSNKSLFGFSQCLIRVCFIPIK